MKWTGSVDALLGGYDGILLDAYGVLVDKQGALPGAAALVEGLIAADRPFLVLTNSASRLPGTLAGELREAGIPVPDARVLTSGMLLADYFREQGLVGSDCLVLGPAESAEYAVRAGARVVEPREDADAEVLVIADQKGFACLEGMDLAVSLALRRLDAGLALHIVVCNPDLIYPVAPGRYGFTAGGLAAMLEAVMRERYPGLAEPMVRLGKPHAPLFEAARRCLGGGRLVMLGDQLATDVLGANRCGIDSVLVGTGLARDPHPVADVRPTWYLASLGQR